MKLTEKQLEEHILKLRIWAKSPLFDVGDYRRQILLMADVYEDELKRMRNEHKL